MNCYEKFLGIKPDNTYCEMVEKDIEGHMRCLKKYKIKPPPDFCFYEFRKNKDSFKEFKDM
jgi:hypothetical protein